jgi:hypothetical protein
MPSTNITPARVAGNLFYIQARDRPLFTLGPTKIHLPGPNGPVLKATVSPERGGTGPFTVHCPDLFHPNSHSLLPLRNGDVVHYKVVQQEVHITQVVGRTAGPPVRPISQSTPGTQPAGVANTLRPTGALSSSIQTSGRRVTGKSLNALPLHPPKRLPDYLKKNSERILNQSPQNLPAWDAAYDSHQDRIMVRLKNTFPQKKITRNDLIKIFTDWKDPVLGLVATMVWGGIRAKGEKGNHLHSLLQMGEDNLREKMERLRKIIRSGDLERAFKECSSGGDLKLNGVGYAFFTKLFCFIGHVPPVLNPAPLILDRWTSNAFLVLGAQAAPKISWEEFFDTAPLHKDQPATWRKPPDSALYRVFVSWFNHWAGQLRCSALQLEQFVFGLSRKTKAGKGPQNPRNELIELGKTLFRSP